MTFHNSIVRRIYPRRSSNPFPRGVLGLPPADAALEVGATAPGLGVVELAAEAAPQMPA